MSRDHRDWHAEGLVAPHAELRLMTMHGEEPAAPVDAGARDCCDTSDPLHHFIPCDWAWMAPLFLGAFAIESLGAGAVPRAIDVVYVLVSSLLCILAPRFARIEQGLGIESGWRYPLLLCAVGLPMLLFGTATSHWTSSNENLELQLTVTFYIIAIVFSAALLNGRLTAIIAAIMGLWIGVAIPAGSVLTIALLIPGGGIGIHFALRQARAASAAMRLRERREREGRRAEDLLTEYEQTGQGWFWETDRRGQLTYVSPHVARLFGRSREDMIGRAFISLFMLEVREQESERTLVFHLATRSSFADIAVRAASDEEEERWWSITGRPVLDQFNNFLGFRGSGTDLTEARKSQRHVTELARFDSLTKLANRFQMSEWLGKILASPRAESRACAVFLLDLDRFKQVNDTMGHPAGDALLVQVANRLRSTVGSVGRVGRLGGDEFQVILPGRFVPETLAHLAKRIIENVSQPYTVERSRVTIGVSLGIALCPDDGTSADALIRNADLALYAAKDGGRGRHHFYAEDLHSEAKARQKLEQDLRDAIAGGALELHYQPQVHTTTERITGFEALLRWKHPELGYISPARFVPIAEDSGLVGAIGEWALRTACHDLAKWPDDVRVAVNVSPLQFAQPGLPAIVTSAIASAGIAPGRLELEITESVFLEDSENTEQMIAALKHVGVRLALDDFGTGYSSLGYLRKAPFDKIKIDRSFVRGATVEGSRNGAIISAIVSLAEALGMETTAEGVETLDELDLVRMLGCSHVQGYIYERPLNRQQAASRMAEGVLATPCGPRSARAPRHAMLRQVVLEHAGHRYNATIRNLSQTGAMIEGLWQVPEDTEFAVYFADDAMVLARARWCREGRMGVAFAAPLPVDAKGSLRLGAGRPLTPAASIEVPEPARRAGRRRKAG